MQNWIDTTVSIALGGILPFNPGIPPPPTPKQIIKGFLYLISHNPVVRLLFDCGINVYIDKYFMYSRSYFYELNISVCLLNISVCLLNISVCLFV